MSVFYHFLDRILVFVFAPPCLDSENFLCGFLPLFTPFPWNTFRVFYLYVRAYLFWGHNSVCYASALRGHLRTHRQKPKKGNQCDHVTFDLKVIARFTEFWQTNAMTINSSLCFKLKIPLFYLLKTRLKFATLVKWPKIDFHGCLGIEWVVFLSQN